MVCLRESLPEVREQIQNLADKLGVDYGTAKIILQENNGYNLDKAPSGAQSKLYQTLLEHYDGDERKALIAKAKTYLQPFFDWFGNWTDPDTTGVSKVVDENGEPLPTGYVAARQVQKAIKDGNDGVIYENINDPFEMNSYGIFLPNQAKSIDNRGTFSTTDDRIEYYNPIYDSLDNDQPMSDETFDALTSYPKDGKYTAKQFMQTMLTSNEFFQEPVQQEIALRLFDKITPEMEVVFSNDQDELMFCKGDTITVTLNAFKRMNTYEFGHGFMHEVMHPIIRKEAGEGGYLFKTIERIRKDVESKVTKEELKDPLFYGLRDSKDFASEIFTNPFFRDELVKRYSPKWWRKLLQNILNFFGLKKLGDKVIKDSEYVYNEISKIVEGYTGNPAYDKLVGNTIERYAPGITNQILKDATNEAKKIQTGLNTRLKALKSALNQDPVRIADLQKQIRQYEDMLIQGEIQECFVDFIKTSNPLYNSILKKMRRAIVDPNTISNDELLQIKNDFIDFYGPTLAEFKNNFFVNGFFDNLSPNEKTVIARNLTWIERAHTEIQAKWNVLIKDKAATVLKTFAEAQGRPTEDIDNYLNDELNQTDADINYYSRFIQSSGRVTDMAVSTMHRVMSDCDQETTRFANEVFQDLKRAANGVSRKDILLLFEKDSQGRATGKLIRPLNYGAFQNDYKAFITRLNQSYGVTEGEVYSLPDDEFIKYHREKENWLCNHCERKFKESYYLAYAELSPTTRRTLSDINDEIKRITDKVASSTGAKLENLSDYDYKRLNDLYKYKRNLANKYDEYGNIKFGDDLKIAEELTKFNKTIASGGFGVSYTQQQIKDLIDTKKRTLSAAEFKKWYDRNVSITYSQAFSDQLSNLAKTDYGQRYKDLQDEKNALLRYGRDTITPYVDASKLSPEIRQRIKEIDEEQAYIRETTVGIKTGTIPFSLIANTEPTLRYNHDKAAAQAKGQAYYQKWYDDNHVDGKPVSYYTKLIPKHQSDIEFRLNPMNQELSSDSPLMNPNFDFSSTETRQPKINLYDNSEAFAEALKTPLHTYLYNKIVEIMEQANQKLPWLDMQSAYNLPQKTGDKIDYLFRSKSNIFKGWWNYNVDAMTIRPDDPGYALDNFSAKPGGGQIDFIPTYYVRQLDNTDYISRNLLGMVAEYARMAENYRIKREHQGDFMVIDEMLAGRDVVGKNGLVAKRAGSETKTYKKYHEMLNMRLYGRMFKEFTVNWGFVKFKFPVKAWQNMISYATKLGLAWNRNSIVKSFFQAHLRTITEAVGHRYFNATDLICAIGQQIAYIPKWFVQLGNPYANDFSIALMQHLNIAREFTLNIEDLQYNRLFRIASKYGMMGGWSFIDYFVKTPIIKAIAANFRLDPTSGKFMPKHKFINTYYADDRRKGAKEFKKLKTRWINVVTSKNGKIVPKNGFEHLADAINDKDTINLLRNVSEFVTNRIDGKISEEDKTQWMTSIIGSAACMHRWYYLFNLDDNFASRYQYNPMIEDYYEARFQSVAKVIIKSMQNLAIAMQNVFGANKEYKKMSSVSLYNFRRSLGHLLTVTSSVMLLYGLIYPLIFGIGKANDDDDDNDDSFDVSDLFDDTENTAKKHNPSWRFQNFAKDVLVGLAASAEAATQEEYSEYPTISFKNGLFKPTIPLLNQLDGGDIWSTITPASSGFSSLYNATFGNLFNLDYNFSKTYKSGSYEGMHYGTRNIIRAIPGLRNLMDFGNVYKTHSMVTKNRPDVFWAANDLFRKKPKKQTESDFDFDFDFDF